MNPTPSKPKRETITTLKKLSDAEFERNVARVEYGITDDARLFLRRCALFLEVVKAPPVHYSAYLAECLHRLASNESPWGKGLLKRSSGKVLADQFDHDFGLAKDVWKLLRSKPPRRRGEKPIVSASIEVASQHNMRAREHPCSCERDQIEASWVEALYYRFRPILDREDKSSKRARAAQDPVSDSPARTLSPEFLAMLRADEGAGFPDRGLLSALRAYIEEREDELYG